MRRFLNFTVRSFLLAAALLTAQANTNKTNASAPGFPASGVDIDHGLPHPNSQGLEQLFTADWTITFLPAGYSAIDVSSDGHVVLLRNNNTLGYYRWSDGTLENLGGGRGAFINAAGAIAVERYGDAQSGNFITVTQPTEAAFGFSHRSQVFRYTNLQYQYGSDEPLIYYTYSDNNYLQQLDSQNRIWFDSGNQDRTSTWHIVNQIHADSPVTLGSIQAVSRGGHAIVEDYPFYYVDGVEVANDGTYYYYISENGVALAQPPGWIYGINPLIRYLDGHTETLPDWMDTATGNLKSFNFVASWVDSFDRINGHRGYSLNPAVLVKKLDSNGQPISPIEYNIVDYVPLAFPANAAWTSDARVDPTSVAPQLGIATNSDTNVSRSFVATRRVQLAVDANHDGAIKLSSEDSTDAMTSPFIFGLNTNHDNGSPSVADFSTGKVNGQADLKDFVPVFLDLKALIAILPPGNGVVYKLKQADSALSFVYTSLTRATAFTYQTDTSPTGYGPGLVQPAATATTVPITADGVDIFNGQAVLSPFYDTIVNHNGGMVLVEGGLILNKPLVLSIEKNGHVLLEYVMELAISSSSIAVDANHDHVIKLAYENSSDSVSADFPFRLWVNDDFDGYRFAEGGIPQTGAIRDCDRDVATDLKDFLPVYIDIKQLLNQYPYDSGATYKLKQEDSAVRFVYTTLSRPLAFHYRSDPGEIVGKPATLVTATGVQLSDNFLIYNKSLDQGVILVEGVAPTDKPLVLVVEKNGAKIAELSLPLKIAPRILLLLHGMNSNPATWQDFVDTNFNGNAPIITNGGDITGSVPPLTGGARCYRLQFGAYDHSSNARKGLENWTVDSVDSVNPNVQEACGDYEDFPTLGKEVDEGIARLIDRNPQFAKAEIVLLGHSRGGLAARAFLQSQAANKTKIVGLLTTSSPHQGSPLASIYDWLNHNARHVYDSSNNEITVPYIVGYSSDGTPNTVQLPVNWQNWSVVDFLRAPHLIQNVFLEKDTLDVRRPVISEVASNSSDLNALNSSSALSNLPLKNIMYGEIVYHNVQLGYITSIYSVFNGLASPIIVRPLTDDAKAFILGKNANNETNTPDTFSGDGLVPVYSAQFTTLPDFHSLSIDSLDRYEGTVVHTSAPSQSVDLLNQLRALVPDWYP